MSHGCRSTVGQRSHFISTDPHRARGHLLFWIVSPGVLQEERQEDRHDKNCSPGLPPAPHCNNSIPCKSISLSGIQHLQGACLVSSIARCFSSLVRRGPAEPFARISWLRVRSKACLRDRGLRFICSGPRPALGQSQACLPASLAQPAGRPRRRPLVWLSWSVGGRCFGVPPQPCPAFACLRAAQGQRGLWLPRAC